MNLNKKTFSINKFNFNKKINCISNTKNYSQKSSDFIGSKYFDIYIDCLEKMRNASTKGLYKNNHSEIEDSLKEIKNFLSLEVKYWQVIFICIFERFNDTYRVQAIIFKYIQKKANDKFISLMKESDSLKIDFETHLNHYINQISKDNIGKKSSVGIKGLKLYNIQNKSYKSYSILEILVDKNIQTKEREQEITNIRFIRDNILKYIEILKKQLKIPNENFYREYDKIEDKSISQKLKQNKFNLMKNKFKIKIKPSLSKNNLYIDQKNSNHNSNPNTKRKTREKKVNWNSLDITNEILKDKYLKNYFVNDTAMRNDIRSVKKKNKIRLLSCTASGSSGLNCSNSGLNHSNSTTTIKVFTPKGILNNEISSYKKNFNISDTFTNQTYLNTYEAAINSNLIKKSFEDIVMIDKKYGLPLVKKRIINVIK